MHSSTIETMIDDKPVILHTEASDGWGGQEIRIMSEMLGLRQRGYTVILAAPAHSRIYERALREDIEAYPVGMNKSSFISAVWRVAGIIRDREVSIINTHSSRDSWIGSMAARISGIPVIRTRHISSKLNGNILTKIVYNQLADAIITTGVFIKDQLIREVNANPDKVFSIPTGMDVERFERADGNPVRRSLGIGQDEKVLGVAAVLRGWKGHDFVIKAMPDILSEFPGTRLVIAGDGPMRGYIETVVKDLGLEQKVMLLGHRDDIARVIKSFDISVLASYASEGVPQFLIQSMAAGKPIIGARTGGIPEVVLHGVNGLVVEPRNPAAIATAAKELLGDPERMRHMGEAGHRLMVERYTRERMLDELEALYSRLLK
jgi:glycosyltransferase involved in cell wall biosynthesis